MSNVKRVVGTALTAVAIATAVAPAAGAVTVAPTTHASKHVNVQPDRRCHRWGMFRHHRRCDRW
jgi:Spy/CpxP family protein refolding chaperone